MPRYEFVDGTSSKFWEIELAGDSFTTTYGRIGAEGQTTTKDFDSADRAKKEYDKLVAEKVKKGYKLVGGKRAVFADEGDDEVEKPEPAPKRTAAGARYFEFSEGTSHKFWEIRLDGTSFTTRFGKIGTSGQESVKDYDSADKTKKEYDKLVAEKVKKGYSEK